MENGTESARVIDLLAEVERLDAEKPELRSSYEVFQKQYADYLESTKQFQTQSTPGNSQARVLGGFRTE